MKPDSKPHYAVKRSRFQEIISRFPEKKVLIVGDVGVDRYTYGQASRLSPEAPVPVVAVTEVKDKLGLAANVADNIKTFGANPYLASMIGRDRHAEELVALLRENRIATDYVFQNSARRTTMKERVIAQTQQVVRIDHEKTENIQPEQEKEFLGKVIPMISGFDAIILEDYAKGLLTDRVITQLVDAARKQKIFISVDPPSVGRTPGVYRGVSMITPNTSEAERLTGIEIRDDRTLLEAGAKLQSDFQIPTVVITRGAKGMTVFTEKGEPLHVPTFARAVYDVSGAGDTVISMLSLALVSGASLEEGALLANFAAGVEVGKHGTATVTIQELEEYMQNLGGLF